MTAMERVPITASGFAALEKELKHRQQQERHRIITAISEARALGDLSENAEYHSAKEAQSHNEGRIQELESLIGRAEIIDVAKLTGTTVKFGATVKLIDDETEEEKIFQIVGEPEADIKSLIGKGVGDSIEVTTPRGLRSYEVMAVAFK
jgi:transcription elongation factor GreA